MLGLKEAWRRWIRRDRLTLAAAAGVLTLLTGCVVGPDYVRPPVVTPAAYSAQAVTVREKPSAWVASRPSAFPAARPDGILTPVE
jgi:hypothetical protein